MTWRDDAACLGLPASWFITAEPNNDNPRAKALCARCPVEDDCLLDAIATERHMLRTDATGIRGGLTPIERRELARTLPLDISTTKSPSCGSSYTQPSAHTNTRDRTTERRSA